MAGDGAPFSREELCAALAQVLGAELREYMTTEQAADYLNVTPGWLEQQRHLGGGPPYVKMHRQCRYRRTDLDTWAAARVYRSTSDNGSGASS